MVTDIQSLQAALQHSSLIGIALGFATGLIFSFNPVAIAAIPVTLAYVTKAHAPRRAAALGGAFIGGMLVTHAVLGIAAALGGEWVKQILGRHWGLVLGPVLILLGLIWPGWVKIQLPWFSMRGKAVAGIWGAFALGIPFSIAVCPFCTPALLVMLTAAAGIGSVAFGFALLLAFAVGRSIPIILGAWAMGWLESLNALRHYQKTFEIVGALILIASGLYLLNEYFFVVGYD